jgi:division protein CdvB (Snf7/Vps24/ESCRT-III family)
MRMMNKKLNMPQLQKIMLEFEKQNERMEMTSDMMGDAVDDAMGVRTGCSANFHACVPSCDR